MLCSLMKTAALISLLMTVGCGDGSSATNSATAGDSPATLINDSTNSDPLGSPPNTTDEAPENDTLDGEQAATDEACLSSASEGQVIGTSDEPASSDEAAPESENCEPPGFMSFLSVADNNVRNSVDLSASFFRLSNVVTLAEIDTTIAPILDQCLVAPVGERTALIRPVDLSGLESEAITAGEVIPVTSPAGSYAELILPEDEEELIYVNSIDAVPLMPPSPSALSYTIPGDAFPATAASIALPDVTALQWISPDLLQPIGPARTFTWVADNVADSTLFISLIGDEKAVGCAVADDGQFALSAATQAELGAGFRSLFGIAFRARYDLVQRGNTVHVSVRIVD